MNAAHLVLLDRLLESGEIEEHEIVGLGVWEEGTAILGVSLTLDCRSEMWSRVRAGSRSLVWSFDAVSSWGNDMSRRSHAWAWVGLVSNMWVRTRSEATVW